MQVPARGGGKLWREWQQEVLEISGVRLVLDFLLCFHC